MGTDLEFFVHPERISSQLICPICTQVLKDPVQTATEHLFCEEELLEWMTRSNLCPITKILLNPEKITKPSRIILNMLAELEIFCSNRKEGCNWTGAQEHLPTHLATCEFRPRQEMQQEIHYLKEKLDELNRANDLLENKHQILVEENVLLRNLVDDFQERLRVFHALAPNPLQEVSDDENHEEEDEEEEEDRFPRVSSGFETDAKRLTSLRSLRTFYDDDTRENEDSKHQYK
jgi:hypothetical protein